MSTKSCLHAITVAITKAKRPCNAEEIPGLLNVGEETQIQVTTAASEFAHKRPLMSRRMYLDNLLKAADWARRNVTTIADIACKIVKDILRAQGQKADLPEVSMLPDPSFISVSDRTWRFSFLDHNQQRYDLSSRYVYDYQVSDQANREIPQLNFFKPRRILVELKPEDPIPPESLRTFDKQQYGQDLEKPGAIVVDPRPKWKRQNEQLRQSETFQEIMITYLRAHKTDEQQQTLRSIAPQVELPPEGAYPLIEHAMEETIRFAIDAWDMERHRQMKQHTSSSGIIQKDTPVQSVRLPTSGKQLEQQLK